MKTKNRKRRSALALALASTLGFCAIAALWILGTPRHDVFLYVQCPELSGGRIEIDLWSDDEGPGRREPLGRRTFELPDVCRQTNWVVAQRVSARWLATSLRLYDAEGRQLATSEGSRANGNILLDASGFHVDLEVTMAPPRIAFHEL